MLSSRFGRLSVVVVGMLNLVIFAAHGAAGQVEANFPQAGFSAGRVYAICLQTDGRILLGGEINAPTPYLARLNLDGSRDTTFDSGSGPDLTVYSIATQPDGAVLIGGAFTQVNQRARRGLARLSATGTLDTTFAPTLDGTVLKVAVQADGKVLAGGDFKTVNGQARPGFVRLLANGSLDTAFNHNLGLAIPGLQEVTDVLVQPDGRLVVAYVFLDFTRASVARLFPDGTLDRGFVPPAIDSTVRCLALQLDGKLVLGGTFRTVGGQSRNLIARLEVDGHLDTTFQPGRGAEGASFPFVNGVAVEASGNIVLAGGFTTVDGVKRLGVARLFPNGHLDPGLVADLQARNGAILDALALQVDGRILVGGHLGTVNNEARPACARLAGTPVLRLSSLLPGASSVIVRGAVTPKTVLEASTDLIHWAPMATNSASGLETEFALGDDQRSGKTFFRARH